MITQKNRDTRCKYGVTILCLFFITIFCGCITEEERIAQMNAEKAKQERIEKLRKELQERQERSNKLSSIITSTDISYLGDLAKNNDDSTFRNAAINRLINLISPSHVAVKIDPMMRGTRSIRYVMGTKENAVYVSAEMARSTDPNVIMRIARTQQEVSQKLSEQQKEQITNRSSEVINCIIDVASNSKFEDVKLKLIDINPPDAALLQKIAMCDNEKVAFAAIEKLGHAKHPVGNSQKSKRLSSFASYAENRVDIPDGIIRTLKEDDIRELAVEVETQKELKLFSKIVDSPRCRFRVRFETTNEGDDHVSIVSLSIGKHIIDLSPKVTEATSKDWFVEIAQNAKTIAVRKYAVQNTTNRKLLAKLQFHDTDESIRTAAKLRLDELTEKENKIAELVKEYHWKEILEIGKDDASIASSVELAKNQIRLERIAKDIRIRPETRSNAISGIRNQYFLMGIVTNEPGTVEGRTALACIHIAKVLKGRTDDEIIAFATSACKHLESNRWNGALDKVLDKVVECIDLCSEDSSKAKILIDVLDKVDDLYHDERHKAGMMRLTAFLRDRINGNMIKVILTEGKGGTECIMPYITPEIAADILAWDNPIPAKYEIELSKLVTPDKITSALLHKVKDTSAKNILYERMPANIKVETQKALDQKIEGFLTKALEKGKDTFVLKGFYLGMPISEAQELVSCYLPKSQVVITKHNDIEIDVKYGGNFDVTPMYFCRADKDGKVYLFNFDKRFLRKWFKYDVQDYHEWAIMFGREFKIPFRQKSVKGKYAASDIVINVAQDCYQYKNNMKDYMVSFFGEKDVFDPYGNPTLSEALSNDHRAFRAGVILRGKEWVKNDWENEDGAREGTLRVRLLKDGE